MKTCFLRLIPATIAAVVAVGAVVHATTTTTTTSVAEAYTTTDRGTAIASSSLLRSYGGGHDLDAAGHRKLISFDIFCPVDKLPNVECKCQAFIFPPSVTSECILEEPQDGIVCAPVVGIICGVPAIKTTFSIFRLFTLRLPIGVALCYKDLSIFDFDVPLIGDLCIDFFDPIGSLLDLLTFGLFPNSVVRDGSDTTTTSATTSYSKCEANVNGEKCEMCQVCDDGLGGTSIMLKCGGLELSSCTTILAAPLPKSVSVPPDLTKAVAFVAQEPEPN